MGLTDLLSDLYAAVSFTELHAEEPQEEKEEESSEEGGEGKGEEGGEDSEEGGEDAGEDGGDDEGGDDDDEEEEEEEEPEDPKPKLEEDCARSAQCAPAKHHYDECVARVTAQEENPDAHHGKKEDCVEEFFHLQHCATQCAAPKLFKMLK